MTEYRIIADVDSISPVFFIEQRTSWNSEAADVLKNAGTCK